VELGVYTLLADQAGLGDVPHREVLRAIELLGTKVAPPVQAG
jgi:hypothetical protein